jgi:hypothetical protein
MVKKSKKHSTEAHQVEHIVTDSAISKKSAAKVPKATKKNPLIPCLTKQVKELQKNLTRLTKERYITFNKLTFNHIQYKGLHLADPKPLTW